MYLIVPISRVRFLYNSEVYAFNLIAIVEFKNKIHSLTATDGSMTF